MFQIDDDKELVPLRRYWIVENNIEWPKFEKKISNSWFDFCFNLFLGLFFGKLFCTTYIIFKSNLKKRILEEIFPGSKVPWVQVYYWLKILPKSKAKAKTIFLKKKFQLVFILILTNWSSGTHCASYMICVTWFMFMEHCDLATGSPLTFHKSSYSGGAICGKIWCNEEKDTTLVFESVSTYNWWSIQYPIVIVSVWDEQRNTRYVDYEHSLLWALHSKYVLT